MNITNFELSQAFVESIGAITCLISAGLVVYRQNNKTTKELRNMFLIVTVMLLCDGAAYIFRGNTDFLSLFMTRVGNYGDFLMNVLLLISSTKLLLFTRPGEGSDERNKLFIRVVYVLAAIDTFILLLNTFTGFMFYFDADNYYHRNTFWYIYTAVFLFGELASITFIIYIRKELGTALASALILFELSPLILNVIQLLIYGLSIAVSGVAIGLIIVMYTYFFSVEAVQYTPEDSSGKKDNYPLYIYTAIIFLMISMSVAFLTCINSFGNILTRSGIEGDGFFILKNIWPSLVIFYVGIVLMLGLFSLMFNKEWRTRKQSAENRLASIQDEMTGVYNRRAYEEALKKGLSRKENHADFTIVMCDINGLKAANDTYGHKAGDELIQGASECICKAFQKYGKIYRIGGDEFVLLLHVDEAELQAALKRLDDLCQSWSHPLVAELSISKGYARACANPGMTIKELIKIADFAMYNDKNAYYARTGKNRRR